MFALEIRAVSKMIRTVAKLLNCVPFCIGIRTSTLKITSAAVRDDKVILPSTVENLTSLLTSQHHHRHSCVAGFSKFLSDW